MRMGRGRSEGANPRNPIRHKLCGLRSVRCERVISLLPRHQFATGIGYSGFCWGFVEDCGLLLLKIDPRACPIINSFKGHIFVRIKPKNVDIRTVFPNQIKSIVGKKP